MQSKAPTIAAYLAKLPAKERLVIEMLDQLVRSAAPSAVGTMKYGMPTYEVGGRILALNAQKNYFSFYADPQIVKQYRTELKELDVGKSCIRFRQIDAALAETLKNIVAEHA